MSDGPQHLATNLVVRLTTQASLCVVQIAVSSLTLLIALFAITYRGVQLSGRSGAGAWLTGFPRGFISASGFVWLSSVCIINIVGSACYVSQEIAQHLTWPETYLGPPLLNMPDPTLQNAYAITSFISAGPLLLATLSFTQSNGTATGRGMGKIFLWALSILPILGFILGIAGGVRYGQADNVAVGQQLLQASAILFLVTLAALVGLTAVNLTFVRTLRIMAITVAMPFLIVRIIYNLLTAFGTTGTVYAFSLPDLAVQIFVRMIMEFIIVLFYLFIGLGAMADIGDGPKNSSRGSGSSNTRDDKSIELGERILAPTQSYDYAQHNKL